MLLIRQILLQKECETFIYCLDPSVSTASAVLRFWSIDLLLSTCNIIANLYRTQNFHILQVFRPLQVARRYLNSTMIANEQSIAPIV